MEDVASGESPFVFGRIELQAGIDDVELGLGPGVSSIRMVVSPGSAPISTIRRALDARISGSTTWSQNGNIVQPRSDRSNTHRKEREDTRRFIGIARTVGLARIDHTLRRSGGT